MILEPEIDDDVDARVALLSASPRFNALLYASKAGIAAEEDAALHYVTVGWSQGLEPLEGVETRYLSPYFEAAGFEGPPALTWLELEAMSVYPPLSNAHAQHIAAEVSQCPSFDAAFYRRMLPPGLDPALHYTVIGEGLGWRPSTHFDPLYYIELYPDCIAFLQNSRLIVHFDRHGRGEGRQPSSVVDEMVFDPLPNDARPVVLVISHEASRTGAPILGWNLIRGLSSSCRVVSVLLRGGDLEQDFRSAAAASTTPLSWSEWNAIVMRRVAERLVSKYHPLYAVANSIETQILIPPLAQLGVPVVALVHEFASYTNPRSKLSNVFDWASHVVFPAKMVEDSSLGLFEGLNARTGIHILRQGRSDIPNAGPTGDADDSVVSLRPPGRENAFVILGAGAVQMRKGVEVFVATAAAARRLRPDLDLLFVWVGDGFDPINDFTYSVYLDEQIKRSDLGDSFILRGAVGNLDHIYQQADLFLLSSRLDPQPNVAIDAMSHGIPTVCFEGAAGTAEVLAADPATRDLVVPHLDATAAAELICKLAERGDALSTLRDEVKRVAREAFDMNAYVAHLDRFGREAARRHKQTDKDILRQADAVDSSLLCAPYQEHLLVGEREQTAMLRWSLWNGIEARERGITPTRPFRRAMAGFHPTVYALAHRTECLEGDRDPLAHFIEAGEPAGSWSRPVYLPAADHPPQTLRVALHAHFHYPELIGNLLWRLRQNCSPVDLFLTTDTQVKADQLMAALTVHSGFSRVTVTPNRGRDIGPFLTGLADEIRDGGYDIFGHVHGKRSLAVDEAMGERWRSFLWENLIGGRFAMLDTAVQAFAGDPSLGLLIAEDPHIVGWNENREIAEALARRMGISDSLPEYFDFPLGTMFLARAAAIRPLVELGLRWEEYPQEPLPNDGTILHAIERLMPFVAAHAGFTMGGLRVPGSSW